MVSFTVVLLSSLFFLVVYYMAVIYFLIIYATGCYFDICRLSLRQKSFGVLWTSSITSVICLLLLMLTMVKFCLLHLLSECLSAFLFFFTGNIVVILP
jgi:hypothetical protein